MSGCIDLDRIGPLIRSFSDSAGIAAGIVDTHGVALVQANWQPLCTQFHRQHPETLDRCMQSGASAAARIRAGEQIAISTCPQGLIDAVAPIVIDGRHLANAFVGQFLLEEPDLEHWRRQAARWGFEEAAYLAAVRQVPIVTQEKARSALAFLSAATHLLGQMGLEALRHQETAAELRDSEARYRSLFRDSPVAIWEEDHSAVRRRLLELQARGVTDIVAYLRSRPEEFAQLVEAAKVLDVNEAAVRLFEAQDVDDLIARSDELEVLGEKQQGLAIFWSALLSGTSYASYDVSWRALAGREIRLVETCSVVPGCEETWEHVVFVDLDVTAWKQTETDLAHANRLLGIVSDVNQMIVRQTSVEGLLSEACRIFVKRGGFAAAWIGFCHHRDKRVVPVAGAGDDLGAAEALNIRYDDSVQGQGPTGTAIRSGRSMVCEDLQAAVMTAPWHDAAREHGYRSSATIPIRVAGEVIGALNVYASELAAFTWEDVGLLEELTDDLGFALKALEDAAARESAEAALRRTQHAVESASDAFYQTDPEGRLIFANRAAGRFSDRAPEELVGMAPSEISADLTEERWRSLWARLREEGALRLEGAHRGPDGSVFPVELTINHVVLDNREYAFTHARDITDRKQAELALRESEERHRHMVETAAEGILTLDAERQITFVNRQLCDLLGYGTEELTGASLDTLLFPEDVASQLQRWEERHDGVTGRHEARLRRKDGSARWVLISARPTHDEHGRFVGVLSMVTDIHDRKLAERRAARTTQRLRLSTEAAVMTLARTIELRDPYTAGHQERVTELAVAIGERLKLRQPTLTTLRTAALIHDLGKIAVPAEILAKPGALSDLEWQIVRRHPDTAYEILRQMRFPGPVAKIVRQHHERLDGSGYPSGLCDDEMLREARILAVADVVEAMSSQLPFRAALGTAAALQEIETGKGRLYDPDAVDACLMLFRQDGFCFTPVAE